MKITQKKTCFGCKALYNGKNIKHCRLGYETGKMVGCPNETLPVEPCPKPMTQKDWATAKITLRKEDTMKIETKMLPPTKTEAIRVLRLLFKDTVWADIDMTTPEGFKKAEARQFCFEACLQKLEE